jgi:hypothetical protein
LVNTRHASTAIKPSSLAPVRRSSQSSPPPHPSITMFIILVILAATRASPLALPSPLVSTVQLQPPSCNDPSPERSLWDIIRSCSVTIFLCTWASVHPNIPSPDERWPRLAIRRVGLMLLALFVPEAIIAWALRQRLAATKLAEENKGQSQKPRAKINIDHLTQKRDGRPPTDSLQSWVVLWNTKETDRSECCIPRS